jgi:hypothetical protein
MAWHHRARGHFILYSIPFKSMSKEEANSNWAINSLVWVKPDPDALNDVLRQYGASDSLAMFPFKTVAYYESNDEGRVLKQDPPTSSGYLVYVTMYRDAVLGPHTTWDGDKWKVEHKEWDGQDWIIYEDENEDMAFNQNPREDEKERTIRESFTHCTKMRFVPAGGDITAIIQKLKKKSDKIIVVDVEVEDQFVLEPSSGELERREILKRE